MSINNINVVGYYSRNDDSAKEASIFTKSKYYLSLKDLIKDSDTIFITTPDDVISSIWEELKKLPIQNKLICHCSGSLSSDIFLNIKNYNSYGYSIHPLFAISDKYNSYKNLNEAFFTIEGDEKYREDLISLIKLLGNKCISIEKENKTLYHAASVMVSNFVVGLINNGVDYLKVCGFNDEQAIEALYPLINFNIENIIKKGTIDSLTGPIERGDCKTVEKHFNAIPTVHKDLYKDLSKNILEIAKKKNCERDYKSLERILEDLK